MKKHVNIPIFIPHLACPNDCTFCNQHVISATRQVPDVSTAYRMIEEAISTVAKGQTCEIAFFGGSFTGIERELMVEYLECAAQFKDRIAGIRLSTRPDYISQEVLNILKRYPVTAIELGMQSMDDSVLAACRRGHAAMDTIAAANLIKENGFSLVLQMMVGLPKDTHNGLFRTAQLVADMAPDAVRIYPCVVLKDTQLCAQFLSGEYMPMPLEEAITECAALRLYFERRGIVIIRMGLFSEPGLSGEDFVAGPFHPAFGELVENQCYYQLITPFLEECRGAVQITVFVARGEISKAAGQKRSNVLRWCREYNIQKINIKEDYFLEKREFRVE